MLAVVAVVVVGMPFTTRHHRLLAFFGFTTSGSENLTNPAQQTPILPDCRRQSLAEIALIFAVFSLQGAWPVPDVNEAYYLGKAIHYWNPEWLPGDFFMETPDAHGVLFHVRVAFALVAAHGAGVDRARSDLGSAGLGVAAAEFCGRAAGVVLGAHRGAVRLPDGACQMAGEWVIGGVEAKGFAYVLVFLGWRRWCGTAGIGRCSVRRGLGLSRAGGRLGGRGGGHRVAWP